MSWGCVGRGCGGVRILPFSEEGGSNPHCRVWHDLTLTTVGLRLWGGGVAGVVVDGGWAAAPLVRNVNSLTPRGYSVYTVGIHCIDR